MIELALDSELLVVFGGSDDENPCIFACYQGIWVQRRVRSRLSPPAASLRTIGPSPEEDAKIAQEHPAKLSAAAVRPGRRRPRSALTSPLARPTRKGRQKLCRMIQSASCRRCRSEARRILSRADLQLQRCNRKETPWTTRCRKRRREPGRGLPSPQ